MSREYIGGSRHRRVSRYSFLTYTDVIHRRGYRCVLPSSYPRISFLDGRLAPVEKQGANHNHTLLPAIRTADGNLNSRFVNKLAERDSPPSNLILYDVVNNTITGTEGRSLTINCTAIGGVPEPDLRLELDFKNITGKQSVQYTVPELKKNHDLQSVKCRAINSDLNISLEQAATLYLYLKPSVPMFNTDSPTANETQQLVVLCTSTGSRPAAVIYWKLKSLIVTSGYSQHNSVNPSTDTYTMLSTLTYIVNRSYNLQPITCGVTHQALGQAEETTKTMTVYSPPSNLILYDVVNNTITGTEGRSLTINCTAIGGVPEPDLRLELDFKNITGKQSVQYTVPELKKNHDLQSVKCRAINSDLNISLEQAATLYLYLKPSVPMFNTDSPTANETQQLVVLCTSTGSRPAAVIYWKLKSLIVTSGYSQHNSVNPSTDTYTMLSTLTYIVNRSYNLQPITCGVTHQALGQAEETTKTMTVYYGPDVVVSNKTYTQADATRSLQCTADGNPAQYTFYKWQHKSSLGVLIRELDGGQNGMLTLPNIQESARYQDSGEYICTVGNGIGDRDGNIKQARDGYLTINAQPVITSDNTEYEFGKDADIHVYVYSIPKYTQMTWSRENTVIFQGNKYGLTEKTALVKSFFHDVMVQLEGHEVTLTISNLKEEDFTTYVLMLTNGFGYPVVYTIVLEYTSAPQTPTNFSATVSSISSIILRWSPGFNGRHDQTYYVEYRIYESPMWFSKKTQPNEQLDRNIKTFTLSGLKAGATYEVRLYAENKFNRSLPTDIESTRTPEDNSSAGPVVGYIVGGVAGTIIFVFLVIGFMYKRGLFVRRHHEKTKRKEEAIYQNQQVAEMYEQIVGATGGQQREDSEQYNMKDVSSTKTYESLDVKGNPNLYAELSGLEEHYEALGEQNKPNVYVDLQSKIGLKENEYANM